MRVSEAIRAQGHSNVTARNRTTFEITKEAHLTTRGDCIIAVNADKGARDLSDMFKQAATREDAEITVIIEAGDHVETIIGRGSPQLTLSHPSDLVIRRSGYISDRTLVIWADKAAINFPRNLVKALKNPTQKVNVTLIAEF